MKKLLAKIRKMLKDRRTRQLLTRIISVTAAIVVFITTYALVLPAITMEIEAQCGIPAHQHDDSCYAEELVCGLEETAGHHHTEDCYSTKLELDCSVEEHQHDSECYDADGNLICDIPEHTHSADSGCYEEVRELACEIPESDGHTHDASCYEKVLVCGKEAHTHSEACYSEPAADTAEQAVEVSSGAAGTGTTAGTGAAAMSAGAAGTASAADTAVIVDNAEDAAGSGATVRGEESEDAATALTTVESAEAGITADGHYVPELAPVSFSTVLNDRTGIYYHPVEDGVVVEDSTQIGFDGWGRIPGSGEHGDKNTELGVNDLLRVYLAYSLPAGTLNPTNPVARYRLPSNLHLTDSQVAAINENVNGIAGGYVNMDTLEILDTEKYYAYLGIEAVEGTRTPSDDPDEYLADVARRTGKETNEYISATVRVENVCDEYSGELLAQDLVFTWTPYTIEKNQHEYDSTGNPTRAGEEISGWLTLDFNMSQVDFPDPEITTFEREVEIETGTETDQAVDSQAVEDQTAEDQTVDDHSMESEAESAIENTEAVENEERGAGESADRSVETVERREQSAEVVFVEEGRDENNQKIHEISTTLTVVSEMLIDTHNAYNDETAADDQSEETGNTENTEDTVSDGEVVEDTDDASADEAEEQYQAGTLTAEGEGYKITLDYTADAKIPADAKLKVSEITEESDPEAYETCLEQAKVSVAAEVEINAESSAENVDSQIVDKNATRFFDIEIVTVKTDEDDQEVSQEVEEKIEPAAPVSVNIQITSASGSTSESKTGVSDEQASQEPTVLHFAEEGVEKIESSQMESPSGDNGKKDNTDAQNEAQGTTEIHFEATSFSIYGVVYKKLSTRVLTVSGKTYEITVSYGADAGIPEEAELRVREISEEEEEYQKAKGLIENPIEESAGSAGTVDESGKVSKEDAALEDTAYDGSDSKGTTSSEEEFEDSVDAVNSGNASHSSVGGMLAFDISIYDPEGNIIEPESAVSVDIKLLSLPEGVDNELLKESMEVHHIVERDGQEKAVLVADVGIASKGTVAVDEAQAEVKFVTDSFSVYTIKWGNNNNQQVKLHFVDENGNDLTTDHSVVFNGATVNGNTVTVSGTNLGIFGNDGILNLEDFEIEGYTLSNTHKSTWRDLEGNYQPLQAYSGNTGKYPHTIIGNELKWTNITLQYRLFYTNSDKAGSHWFNAGFEPYRNDNQWKYGWGSHAGDPIDYSTTADDATYPYDYYLVYSPNPTDGGNGGQNSSGSKLDDLGKTKTLTPNNDGTYTMDLSVTTSAYPDKDSNGINLIILFDTSSSMRRSVNDANTQYDNDNGNNGFKKKNDSRFMQARNALNTFLSDLCPENNATSKIVQLALIDFNYSAYSHTFSNGTYWTTSANDFINEVDKLWCPSGTNWAQALALAQTIKASADDDPTYVLLFTDGAPSQYWGDTSVSGYFVSGEGCYLAARDEARDVVNDGMSLYSIFAFGDTTDENNDYLGSLVDYAYDANVRSNRRKYANQNNLAAQLTSMLGFLKELIAHTAVNYHDGIALDTTSTALATNINGNLGSITYSKTGGKTGDYTVVADTAGNAKFTIDGHTYDGSTETITYTKVTGSTTETGGTGITTQTNATTKVYSCTVGTGDDAKTYIMPIATLVTDEATKEGDLNWDLSPLGLLEDDATYKISFVVWPNQEAYDYVADLNNGKMEWNTATQVPYPSEENVQYYKNGVAQFPNIVYYPDSDTYAALTNTVQEVTYYTAIQDTSSSSQGSTQTTTYDGQFTTYPQAPDPMPLTSSSSEIEKLWNVKRDPGILFKMLYGIGEDGTPVSTKFTITFDVKVDEEENDAASDGDSAGAGAEGAGGSSGGEDGSNAEDEPYMRATLGWTEEEDGSNGHYVWDTADPNYTETVVYNGIDYTVGTRWTTDFSIATGLMLSTARMNALGLDKSAYPSGTYNGTTYYVLEMGHDYTIKEEDTGYEFDFSAPTYHPMLVDGKLQNVNFTKNYAEDGITVESVDIRKMTSDPNGIGSLKIENTLRGYINLDKDVVDKNREPMEDDTQFEYEVTLENENPVFKDTHIPWYGINDLFYHDADFNYYQAEQIMVTGEDNVAVPKPGELYLRDEEGNEYTAACTGTFDPNIIGPTEISFTVLNDDGQPDQKIIQLYGNQMVPSNGSEEKGFKTAKTTLKIDQYQTLNIANVPLGTRYSIKESAIAGYDLIKIMKEIKSNPADSNAESSTTYENGDVISSRTITGTIVSNRDNHIVYTNQNKKVNITLQKVDGNGNDLEGAIFQLRVLKKPDSEDPQDGASAEGGESSGSGSSNEGASGEGENGESGSGDTGSGGDQSGGDSESGDPSDSGDTGEDQAENPKKGVYLPAYEVDGFKEIKFNSGKTVKVMVEQEEGKPIEEIRNVDSIPLATIILFEKTYTSTFSTTVEDEAEEDEQEGGEPTGNEPPEEEPGEGGDNSEEGDGEVIEYRMRLEGLPDGEYKLVELKAPDGYVILNNEIEFKIQDYVMTLVTEKDTVSLQQIASDYNGTETIADLKVINEAGAELPNSGGPGTKLIYILGGLLTLAAALLLLYQRKRIRA